ncbi:unnamed protein product [Bursaphelenchus okinawaensis]|uniref:Uncharacterized protein n=1 Tax=Bursaphelenchus okinawaensis TaxID=465554 RepID=A0A811KZ41_9BILA|nr:unnamed protein product [Bursaphelenchus okinawaensis]CAG9114069.1 unnamed protein product [Bursaphelenchus okinawaensis]
MDSYESDMFEEANKNEIIDDFATTSNEKLELILQNVLDNVSQENFDEEKQKLQHLDEKFDWMECPQIIKLMCFFNTFKPNRITITEDIPFFFPTHHKQGMRCMYKRRVFYETHSKTAGVNRWRCNQRGCRGTIYINKEGEWNVIDSGRHWTRECDCKAQDHDKLVAIAFKSIGYKLARLMPTESTKALRACVMALADKDQLGKLDNFDRVIRKNKRIGLQRKKMEEEKEGEVSDDKQVKNDNEVKDDKVMEENNEEKNKEVKGKEVEDNKEVKDDEEIKYHKEEKMKK